MTTQFNKGDIVWAKVKGYPWWPGVIADIQNSIYLINFCHDESHARLSSKSIKPYEENRKKVNMNSKKTKLIEAIKEADITFQKIKKELNNNKTKK